MPVLYKKRQTGWLIILSFLPIILFMMYIIYRQEVLDKPFGDNPGPSVMYFGFIIFFLILLSLFSHLTVIGSVMGYNNYLEIKFGIGLFRKKFYFKDIRDCSMEKNPWYYGWGIRKIPGGWLYHVSGSWSVQLNMKDGRMYRIGTGEPKKLAEFIKSRIDLFAGS
jgi:hypothetical protein